MFSHPADLLQISQPQKKKFSSYSLHGLPYLKISLTSLSLQVLRWFFFPLRWQVHVTSETSKISPGYLPFWLLRYCWQVNGRPWFLPSIANDTKEVNRHSSKYVTLTPYARLYMKQWQAQDSSKEGKLVNKSPSHSLQLCLVPHQWRPNKLQGEVWNMKQDIYHESKLSRTIDV